MSTIVNDQRVVDFVAERVGMKQPMQCYPVGLEQDGTIIAGALFERGNAHNVFMHGAVDRPVTRPFLRALFAYPFDKLGVRRVTVMPPSSNMEAIAWDIRVGFEFETKLAGAAHDGSDLLVFVMWKDRCRWLNSRSR